MAKKHKEIIHNTEKTRHERSECSSFYGSLFVIMFLIVGTAVLLTNSGNNDVTGMATTTVESALNQEGASLSYTYQRYAGKTDFYKLSYDTVASKYKLYSSKANEQPTTVEYDKYEEALASLIGTSPTDMSSLTIRLRDRNNNEVDKHEVIGVTVGNHLTNTELSKIMSEEFSEGTLSISRSARTTELESTADEIGGGITPEDLVREEEATNNWIESTGGGYTYDVNTGHYTGTIDEKDVDYHDNDIGIKTAITTQKKVEISTYVYKDTSTIPPTYYYMEGDKEIPYKPDEAVKSNIRGVEREVEKIEDARQAEVERCKSESYDCKLKDGENKEYTQNARKEAYMNRLYAEQEAKVQGLIAGWLNGWIDEKLSGWSRGVPAGICAYIFGLEYYKQDGWTRVAMNSSVDQLQSQLIANSRTVIIEGEKEEITEEMFRYAYTIKLLANQSVEWQTYLYNSCTQETSVDSFYDYGSLAAGGYFAFHYAGAGTQDMIFECEQEICLYDQACVVFADGSAPTCVSLVHGAGFETPVAGNEYDCAITG